MEIKGTLKKSLPLETGQGKQGEWKKRPVVIETAGPYPKEVVLEFWNDKIGLLTGLKAGLLIAIDFELSSREGSNGRWYTSAKALNLSVVQETAPKNPASQDRRVEREPQFDESESDSLPF